MSTELPADAPLSAAEMERYQAHLALPDFGPGGQARLRGPLWQLEAGN